MNLEYEFLQELVIKTDLDRILRLHIGQQSDSYRLYGEYFEPLTQEWTRVDFSDTRHKDAIQLLAQCIKDFATAMSSKNDKIKFLHNPCNAKFVNVIEQESILSTLSIYAIVSVN